MPPTTFIRTTGEFGHRFIADELHAAGLQTSERRVWRLCSAGGSCSRTRSNEPGNTARSPARRVCDDLVERDFTAKAINELWLTDVTEHHTSEGKLYMCAVKDGRFQGANATLLMSWFESLTRSMESESLPRTIVELIDQSLDCVVGDVIEIGALRVVIADEAVQVLV